MKLFITSLVLSFTVLLVGCSNDTTTNEATPPSTEPTETENEEETTVVADTVIPAENPAASPVLAQNRGGTVVVGLQEPGGVFTPFFNTSGYDGNVQSVMFPPLVEINELGEFIPGLAEDWTISADELTYTFVLRENLKFDNGSPLTTEDIKFTLTLLHDPSYAGGTDITEANIIGGLDYKEGDADTISGIKIIDERTIEITTEEVNARALRLLGGQVLSKAYYGADYKKGDLDYINDLHLNPLGAGPFRFVQYIPGQEIRYEANEHYFAGKPEVELFIYKTTEGDSQQFFQTGELDYSGFAANADNFELLQSLGFADINLYTSSAYSYITFNHENPIFEDPRVRQAFILGLDRETIVNIHFQGYAEVANVPVSPASWAYTDDVGTTSYDLEKAKELLDEAGWIEGANGIREKDGEKLQVYYFTSAGGISDTLIPIATENYTELGIDFQVEQMDFNALLSRVDNGEHDLASFSTPMLTDPYNGVANFHSKNTSSVVKGYGNSEIDALIDATNSTTDLEERTAAFHELYKALDEEPPVILLSYSKVLSATNARVEGFAPNGYRGISTSLKDLRIINVNE
ncbi:ABC transporter substrate-binding protein [Alkalihalobacillus sp. 1P02AB]|uniref:ABC transporter substrate-binding protein n=1 Tax=Alkalihalobacillus sp. 1P02AB TaxID=3132260 RepID=UPI0039A543F2